MTDYLTGLWKTLTAPVMGLFYHPDSVELPLPPELQGTAVQEIFFHTTDGVRLHARFYLSPQPAKGTLVQFHGNAGNLSGHIVSLAWLSAHGYNLFTFDYRGYGRSQSVAPSPAGLYHDALAALREVERLHRAYAARGVLVVIGQSLGGVVALKALEDFPATLPIDLLVLDSTFASYREVAFRSMVAQFPGVLLSPLAYLLVSDAYAADLRRSRYPLLVMHSKKDQTVPFSCGQRIYEEAASAQKDFWVSDAPLHILLDPTRKEIKRRFLQRLTELE